MVDISEGLGLPAEFYPRLGEIIFGRRVSYIKAWGKNFLGNEMSKDYLWKSMKLAVDFTDDNGKILKEPDLEDYGGAGRMIYRGFQGVYWDNHKMRELLKQQKLRPDITILQPGVIGEEYVRTEGHEHASGLPEVYETVHGKNGYLLFKTNERNIENIDDVFFVFAEAGEHVLFPPAYQHISINIGNEYFLMTDWVSTEANSDFKYIKRHNGAPYWVVKSVNGPEFIRNPRYKGRIPDIRLLKPAEEIPEFGLKKGKAMFNLAREGKTGLLDFLNDSSEKYNEIYRRAYVSLDKKDLESRFFV